MKTSGERTPKTIEKFELAHWAMLIVLEEYLFSKKGKFDSTNSPPYQDLVANDFVREIDAAPHFDLTDRGWEVVGKLRRWCAEKRPIADFIISRCSECSRLRYGEKGPCHCGSTK